jgi:hypothetical protein
MFIGQTDCNADIEFYLRRTIELRCTVAIGFKNLKKNYDPPNSHMEINPIQYS